MDSSSNPIEAVRERLDGGRKWIKSNWGCEGGPRCVNGAAREVADAQWEQVTALISEVALEQYPERCVYYRDLSFGAAMPGMEFNNHPLTTWPEMDGVLDKAARRWDEQVRP